MTRLAEKTVERLTAQQIFEEAESERDFVQKVVSLFRLCGWRIYHTWNSLHSEPGFPDLIALKGHRMVVAEAKSQKGVVTEAQQAWLDAFKLVCKEVFVWRPSGWVEIVKIAQSSRKEKGIERCFRLR